MKKGFFDQPKRAPQSSTKSSPLHKGDTNTKPKFLSKNLQIVVSKSSNDMLLLASNKTEGRFLAAVRPFAAGDVLLTADCFATVPDQSNPELCTRCLCRCAKKMQCKECGTTFCSQTCTDLSSAGSNRSYLSLNFMSVKDNTHN